MRDKQQCPFCQENFLFFLVHYLKAVCQNLRRSSHNPLTFHFALRTCLLNMPPTRWTRNASTLANPGPIPADLELGKGKGSAVPVQQAKPRNDWRTCCLDKMHQRGTEKHRKPSWHSAPCSTWERACGKPKRSKCPQTVQELLDRESPQDGLLSATQLTQVQQIVQGSLNKAIEKVASAAT